MRYAVKRLRKERKHFLDKMNIYKSFDCFLYEVFEFVHLYSFFECRLEDKIRKISEKIYQSHLYQISQSTL